MLLFRVGYNDHVSGSKPLMSVVMMDDTVRVLSDAFLAWICPAEMEPLLNVLKNPFADKISVFTIVETGTMVIVEVK
jgi:hypothetical protein